MFFLYKSSALFYFELFTYYLELFTHSPPCLLLLYPELIRNTAKKFKWQFYFYFSQNSLHMSYVRTRGHCVYLVFIILLLLRSCYVIFSCVGMQPTGNFTIPESPPPGYMSEDGEFSDVGSNLSSPASSTNYSSGEWNKCIVSIL